MPVIKIASIDNHSIKNSRRVVSTDKILERDEIVSGFFGGVIRPLDVRHSGPNGAF